MFTDILKVEVKGVNGLAVGEAKEAGKRKGRIKDGTEVGAE